MDEEQITAPHFDLDWSIKAVISQRRTLASIAATAAKVILSKAYLSNRPARSWQSEYSVEKLKQARACSLWNKLYICFRYDKISYL